MKKLFYIALLLSVCTLCHAQTQVVLDLDDGITWQEVFDAGFRPKHLGEGNYMCTQYGALLTIKNSKTGQKVDLGIGDVDFKLKANHQLVQMSFYGRENRSLEEARFKSEAFAKMFGPNLTERAKLKTFQSKHEVDYSGRKIDPTEIEMHVDLATTSNAAKIDDFSIIYSFSDSYSDDLPLVERLSVALKSEDAKRAKRLTEKIRPPAGYEHISLEPNQESDESNSEVDREQTTAERLSYFPWIVAGVILLGILTLLFKVCRGKAAR